MPGFRCGTRDLIASSFGFVILITRYMWDWGERRLESPAGAVTLSNTASEALDLQRDYWR